MPQTNYFLAKNGFDKGKSLPKFVCNGVSTPLPQLLRGLDFAQKSTAKISIASAVGRARAEVSQLETALRMLGAAPTEAAIPAAGLHYSCGKGCA